jgi:diguanylate cyclase (GGDEF)-like protein
LFHKLIDHNQFLIRQAEQLEVAANRDALTGVLNRGAIMVTLERQLRGTGALGETLGVIMTDIDNFKTINDTYGHPAGDLAICEFTRRLSTMLRPIDFLGRYGGEEFLLLIPDIAQAHLMEIARRLCLSIAETPFKIGAASPTVTASFGVTIAVGSATTAATIVGTADRALYAAKANGRNRCEFVESIPASDPFH